MWDFSHIFATKADWEAALVEAEKAIEVAASYKGKLTASAEALADGLDAIYGVAEKFEKAYSYAFLHKEADNSDPEYQDMSARATSPKCSPSARKHSFLTSTLARALKSTASRSPISSAPQSTFSTKRARHFSRV